MIRTSPYIAGASGHIMIQRNTFCIKKVRDSICEERNFLYKPHHKMVTDTLLLRIKYGLTTKIR